MHRRFYTGRHDTINKASMRLRFVKWDVHATDNFYFRVRDASLILCEHICSCLQHFPEPPIKGSPTGRGGLGGLAAMMSADESSLQTLLSNLNIDAAPGYNGEKRVEKLVLQLGELSARYSDLAARYLKLVNSRVTESSDIGSLNDGAKGPFSETSSSHALNEIFAVVCRVLTAALNF